VAEDWKELSKTVTIVVNEKIAAEKKTQKKKPQGENNIYLSITIQYCKTTTNYIIEFSCKEDGEERGVVGRFCGGRIRNV